ncbi:MAG: RNA polymerase subunit sigma [Candidatus Dactylopiibacterium carminicum]|uniref:RNA polymerase subunit sigma n=1 Tax=Candidatus Dactylopiibacterium carminicum TaxID=857335 RepID=A0A272EXU3_9RHOO|nr:sigma-70 family RNA polymerase sigma factor [Candidatus Dactylopiibacterium carminicum]KAF7600510.1 RNA polymerase subunit sigma [Candidatus Dactylopiibacterium carminicum]PAS94921.1 MAG: RNA polymerase subunit sigma [Candidatus Dactylopiibacterium carminicum]PAS98058.1 MAG: RNA polymerase subunit sigma [Candidatus Dactylopiibacterium carminicum]PAT00515.1 MAG: RNA polymerase subunit sigma [Candidatus Dactylopiibacterium carminicum]
MSSNPRPEHKRHEALSLIFRSDYRWLAERLRFRLGCGFQAEDVASEAFAQLAALPDLDHVREPRAMLTTIAQRVMYETWRRRDLERAYLNVLAQMPEAVHPSPEDRAQLVESLLAIDQALDGLSAKARSAFLYSQLDGLTYAEIGEQLGVSASMVRQYMAKALACCYAAAEA